MTSIYSNLFQKGYFATALLALSPSCLAGFIVPERLTVYATDQFADAKGFIQIPTGGKPGTTSSNRPTLNELGINNFNPFYQIGLLLGWQQSGWYGEYQNSKSHANATLTQDLITHNFFLPAGTAITTTNRYDLYRLGYYRRYLFCAKRFLVAPEVEITAFNFDYHFNAPAQVRGRSFCPMTARFGVGGEYLLNTYLSVIFNGASSIPSVFNLQIQTANLDLSWNFHPCQRLHTSVYGGIGYQRIDFKDKQEVPNHIEVTQGPIGRVGLRFTFS